jgi:hypothetical protein
MGISPCCKKDLTISNNSDMNLQVQPMTTEPNILNSRRVNLTMKEMTGLTTENNYDHSDFINREGTFMKEYISILSARQKSLSILQYQEDFLFDYISMNKLRNIAMNNPPPTLILKVKILYKNFLILSITKDWDVR